MFTQFDAFMNIIKIRKSKRRFLSHFSIKYYSVYYTLDISYPLQITTYSVYFCFLNFLQMHKLSVQSNQTRRERKVLYNMYHQDANEEVVCEFRILVCHLLGQ